MHSQLTLGLRFICSLRIKALQHEADVLIELVPVAVDDCENIVTLGLPLLQLLNTTSQVILNSFSLLQTLPGIRIGLVWNNNHSGMNA